MFAPSLFRPLHSIRTKFLIVLLSLFTLVLKGQPEPFSAATETLLSRINLDEKGLRDVQNEVAQPVEAATELLNYYRHRTSVQHPIDRNLKTASLGQTAKEKDLKVADNALKHIFVGQPAYPPHFCGNDIDWSTSPVPDKEWLWQLHRMSFWDAMGRAYWHTGDEKYARAWGQQLIDWTQKNPRDEDHKYAWRSIEAGIRGFRWTSLFQRFIDSPSFSPEVLVAFLNSCHDHAQYLMARYRSGSNWGLMEAEGLAFIALTFPEFKHAEKWRDEAFRRLNREINIQVNPDGHQRELAIGYHLGCIHWFLRTYELAKMNGIEDAFPASYLRRIEQMCEVPMKLCLPDGRNVQFGDAWEGSPGQHQRKFQDWADFFRRDDFLYLATDGDQGQQPDSTAYALKESGLYSMRSGWDKEAICLVLKCGPDGGGHSQPDNGTFDLYAGGRNLMPDGGSYIYSGNPEGRAWFRQTRVHQTLTLNEANSAYDPQLLLWQPGDSLDILVVENQSYDELTHRRSVFFVDKRYFIILDEAIGTATGDVAIHFQLAPGEAVYDHTRNTVHSNFDEGWNVLVRTNPQNQMTLEKEEGWVSFKYTEKEERPAFRYRIPKSKPDENIRFVTVVAPYETAMPDIQVRLPENLNVGSGSTRLVVEEFGKKWRLGYSLTDRDD